jgi:eukaryotic-like serine/threonine-protein kinase
MVRTPASSSGDPGRGLSLTVVVLDPITRSSRRYAFHRSPVSVGRRADNDIVLPYPFISAEHGIIQFDASEIRYTDLGSRNGSLVGGRRLAADAPVHLATGQEVTIGNLLLKVDLADADRPRPGAISTPDPPTIGAGVVTDLMRRLASAPEFGAAEVQAGRLRPGSVIGRFELLRELGRGGFGVVFEAADRQLGRHVALKVLRVRETPRADPGDTFFWREAEAAARLNHPNIVTLHDVGTWEGGLYLVMELLRGQGLDARLQLGPLPASDALRVAIDVARALAHAHLAGVVHRDLKPSNVFITEGGWAKVLDFGLAQVCGGGRAPAGGTPTYVAPEQWDGGDQGSPSDVFSAALVFCETLTGHPVPRGPDREVLWHPPRGSPEPLRPLLESALARDPAKRPVDGNAWLEALLAAQRQVRE